MEEVLYSIFAYGSLRGDCCPSGDQWGVISEYAGTHRRALITGFKLFVPEGCGAYPLVVRTDDRNDVVHGTLLEWPSVKHGIAALARCDDIEQCYPNVPEKSLYQRCVVDVSFERETGTRAAWVYYQKLPDCRMERLRLIDHGDWIADQKDSKISTNSSGRVFAFSIWIKERLASGDSISDILHRIGAGDYLEENASNTKLNTMMDTFCTKLGGKACEVIRQKAYNSNLEPGIPFVVWLQERFDNGATAAQVLQVLNLPKSSDCSKGDDELWEGLWQLSREEAAWSIVKKMAAPSLDKIAQVRGNKAKNNCMMLGAVDEVASLIKGSSKILVLTGVGISKSCGIPTFRDAGGFYDQVAKEFGLSSPEAVNDINVFKQNPLPWFKHVKQIVPSSKAPRSPSLTHHFICALEDRGKLLWQYTQNIDGLERAAGISRITWCHGSFESATCIKCGHHLADGTMVNDTIASGCIPYCSICGENGVMKPDVTLFNEPMPRGVNDGIEKHTGEADLLLVIGTSLKVAPCCLIPSLMNPGVSRILINAEALDDERFEHFLEGPSDDIVLQLLQHLQWNDPASKVDD